MLSVSNMATTHDLVIHYAYVRNSDSAVISNASHVLKTLRHYYPAIVLQETPPADEEDGADKTPPADEEEGADNSEKIKRLRLEFERQKEEEMNKLRQEMAVSYTHLRAHETR